MTPRFLCNRRRFCRMAGVASFAAAAVIAGTKAAAALPETDYETGTSLLKNGRNYLQAIAVLERAAQAKPDNAAYQSALGCAYAARFASVCCAARRGEIIQVLDRGYANRKHTWDKAQTDAKNPLYHCPLPTPPDLPATPDDHVLLIGAEGDQALIIQPVPHFNVPYLEYKKISAISEELVRLGQKSLAAFNAAHRLASTLPLIYQATVQYERGWGLFLLWREGREQNVVSEQPLPKMPNPPQKIVVSPDAVVEAFRVCVRTDEKTPPIGSRWPLPLFRVTWKLTP